MSFVRWNFHVIQYLNIQYDYKKGTQDKDK